MLDTKVTNEMIDRRTSDGMINSLKRRIKQIDYELKQPNQPNEELIKLNKEKKEFEDIINTIYEIRDDKK